MNKNWATRVSIFFLEGSWISIASAVEGQQDGVLEHLRQGEAELTRFAQSVEQAEIYVH